MVNNPNQQNWKPNHQAVYVSSSKSLAQTDFSTKQTRNESEYINSDLENKCETMNCLQTERVGCNEHNVSEEKTASE